MKAEKKITILLPTRGRPEVLETSLQSLIDRASNPKDIEIMLGIDEDDPNTIEYVKEKIAPYLQEAGVEARANIFKPIGYENLHNYVNTLAGNGQGEWIFFWNDDALMETEGWDEVIDSYTGQFKLLAPKDNHDGHPYAILPIVPRDWYILVGHLSQNAQNDAWLSHIAYMLDIFERIDVEFIHDRADITGNNDDETFKNRKYMEGNPQDPRDFAHVDMQQARVATAHKLAWFMDKMGMDTSWWEKVKTGEQNPFEKMVWAEGVKGAGQLQAVESNEKDKLPDEHTIEL
jgi:glycosyltransferase involved in cell wall biosynthesis